jgi:hypothetical protein
MHRRKCEFLASACFARAVAALARFDWPTSLEIKRGRFPAPPAGMVLPSNDFDAATKIKGRHKPGKAT